MNGQNLENRNQEKIFSYRVIHLSDPIVKEAAAMIQKYSWGEDYPVDAWSELKEAEYIIGCFDRNKLVGMSSVTRLASPDKIDNGLPWYADAVVLPEYRQQGIFGQLYERVMEYLSNNNEELVLSCTANPIVETFLLEHGWTLRRLTKDESGEDCKVLEYNPMLS